MTLQFDPAAAIDHLRSADARMRKVIDRAGPFTMRPEPMRNPFHALGRAIVSQQLSGKAAATIHGRVTALLPKSKYWKPEHLLAIDDQRLRGAGLSGAKTAAIKDLAEKTIDGIVPTMARLGKMDDEEIVERLTMVRGIGRWTVEMLLIFALGRPDVFPINDLGVRKGFMIAVGGKAMPTVEQLLKRGKRWQPYRSVASWYLWRATEFDAKKK